MLFVERNQGLCAKLTAGTLGDIKEARKFGVRLPLKTFCDVGNSGKHCPAHLVHEHAVPGNRAGSR